MLGRVQLGQGNADSEQGQLGGVGRGGLDPAEQLGHSHREIESAIRLGGHLGQHLTMQRVRLEFSAEGLPLAGVRARQHDGPAHDPSGGDGIVQPGDVEHGRHLREASLRRADQLSVRPLQGDLTGCHRASAKLVLQPIDAIAIAATVRAVTADQEEGQPARPRRRAFRSSQGQRDLAPNVGAEELLPEEAPAIAITFGDDGVVPHVGTALSFGHPLARGPVFCGIPADQVSQHLVRLPSACRIGQHAGGAIGHRDRT